MKKRIILKVRLNQPTKLYKIWIGLKIIWIIKIRYFYRSCVLSEVLNEYDFVKNEKTIYIDIYKK